MRKSLWVCLLLILLVFSVYGRTLRYGFFSLGDPERICGEPRVASGLSVANLVWAFRGADPEWSPLGTLSAQAVCTLFGLRAGAHHLAALMLHAANASLMFLALRALTGSLLRSAFAAALFAVHPLNVATVVWLDCRPELLGGFFLFLSLWLYGVGVSRSRATAAVGGQERILRNSLVISFALGLLATPLLLPLPLLLLLLDVWPLRRLVAPQDLAGRLREKTPLLLLAALAAAIPLVRRSGNHDPTTLAISIGNSLINLPLILWRLLWPADPVITAPVLHGRDAAPVPLLVMLAAGLSLWGLLTIRRRPYLLFGLLWAVLLILPSALLLDVHGDPGNPGILTRAHQAAFLWRADYRAAPCAEKPPASRSDGLPTP